MLTFLGKRLLQLIPTLFFVSVIIFSLQQPFAEECQHGVFNAWRGAYFSFNPTTRTRPSAICR